LIADIKIYLFNSIQHVRRNSVAVIHFYTNLVLYTYLAVGIPPQYSIKINRYNKDGF